MTPQMIRGSNDRMTKRTRQTDVERTNRVTMLAHWIDILIMLIFYALLTVSSRPVFILIAAVLGIGPVIIELLLWKKNRETPLIKHLVGMGYAVFYTFVLFTSDNSLMFAFAIPMVLIISVYNDMKFSLEINIGTILETVIAVIIGAKTGGLGFIGIENGIIRIVVMLLIGVYSLFTAKTLNDNSRQKMDEIEEAQNNTEAVLSDVSDLSEKMKMGIEDIHGKVERLEKAAETTKNSMEEVSSGAAETADAVQRQLLQTEAIQNKVDVVDGATTLIRQNMQQTLDILKNAKDNMERLAQKVEMSVENGQDVEEKLKTLNQYMEEMNSIVEIISGITSQTRLLALNASIEAARAGEAGRGFAVVATEITAMAAQTNDATVHITDLIRNVSAAIGEVVAVIQQMIEGINEQRREASNTEEGLVQIQNNTFSVRDNVENLAQDIEELKAANRVIGESVQTISAISEEVSAHANMTMGAEQENVTIIAGIVTKMEELTAIANR